MKEIKHYIIVKLKHGVNKAELAESIKILFEHALKIDDVYRVIINVSNSELENRHDIMIEMHLTVKALKEFDNSKIHKKWKEDYGKYIVSKTIFDCDI